MSLEYVVDFLTTRPANDTRRIVGSCRWNRRRGCTRVRITLRLDLTNIILMDCIKLEIIWEHVRIVVVLIIIPITLGGIAQSVFIRTAYWRGVFCKRWIIITVLGRRIFHIAIADIAIWIAIGFGLWRLFRDGATNAAILSVAGVSNGRCRRIVRTVQRCDGRNRWRRFWNGVVVLDTLSIVAFSLADAIGNLLFLMLGKYCGVQCLLVMTTAAAAGMAILS
mmetsp:Transcript_2802/g.5976  ORF Transcript_2802/g.5976 Transcript_2802/m.5976 type:complete len:222 (-) Transcript_2802:171-836(-)